MCTEAFPFIQRRGILISAVLPSYNGRENPLLKLAPGMFQGCPGWDLRVYDGKRTAKIGTHSPSHPWKCLHMCKRNFVCHALDFEMIRNRIRGWQGRFSGRNPWLVDCSSLLGARKGGGGWEAGERVICCAGLICRIKDAVSKQHWLFFVFQSFYYTITFCFSNGSIKHQALCL